MPRYFTNDHEWIDVDGTAGTVGITDYAQSQLGDITYVELPSVGASFGPGDAAAVVESVKAASDIYAPAAGAVTEVNPALDAEPELVNTQAESGGWLFRVALADAGAVSGLMDQAAYDAYVKEL